MLPKDQFLPKCWYGYNIHFCWSRRVCYIKCAWIRSFSVFFWIRNIFFSQKIRALFCNAIYLSIYCKLFWQIDYVLEASFVVSLCSFSHFLMFLYLSLSLPIYLFFSFIPFSLSYSFSPVFIISPFPSIIFISLIISLYLLCTYPTLSTLSTLSTPSTLIFENLYYFFLLFSLSLSSNILFLILHVTTIISKKTYFPYSRDSISNENGKMIRPTSS